VPRSRPLCAQGAGEAGAIYARFLCELDQDENCSDPNDLGPEFSSSCQKHLDDARAEIEKEESE